MAGGSTVEQAGSGSGAVGGQVGTPEKPAGPARENLSLATAVVLRLLAESGRTAGSDLIRDSGYGPGTIYPILKRLLRADCLVVEDEDGRPEALGRPLRKFYTLTEDGEERAQSASKRESVIRSRQASREAMATGQQGGSRLPFLHDTGLLCLQALADCGEAGLSCSDLVEQTGLARHSITSFVKAVTQRDAVVKLENPNWKTGFGNVPKYRLVLTDWARNDALVLLGRGGRPASRTPRASQDGRVST